MVGFLPPGYQALGDRGEDLGSPVLGHLTVGKGMDADRGMTTPTPPSRMEIQALEAAGGKAIRDLVGLSAVAPHAVCSGQGSPCFPS